jgi:hypothetical protein
MAPQQRSGFWLGVLIFSGTFSATRPAFATLDPLFIACGRPWPRRCWPAALSRPCAARCRAGDNGCGSPRRRSASSSVAWQHRPARWSAVPADPRSTSCAWP